MALGAPGRNCGVPEAALGCTGVSTVSQQPEDGLLGSGLSQELVPSLGSVYQACQDALQELREVPKQGVTALGAGGAERDAAHSIKDRERLNGGKISERPLKASWKEKGWEGHFKESAPWLGWVGQGSKAPPVSWRWFSSPGPDQNARKWNDRSQGHLEGPDTGPHEPCQGPGLGPEGGGKTPVAIGWGSIMIRCPVFSAPQLL